MEGRVGVIQVDPARHDDPHQASVLEYCYLPTGVTTSTLEDPGCNLGYTINATSQVLGYLNTSGTLVPQLKLARILVLV